VGLRFVAAGSDTAFESGRYESPVQSALASLLRPGDIFYDVGANLGFFSVLAGRLVGPTGRVYSFEPVPRNVASVRENARLNRMEQIEVFPIAVSDRTGVSDLLLSHHVGGAALPEAGPPPDHSETALVATARLDDLLRDAKVRPPAVVKIDVEGAELQVLEGLRSILATQRPVVLLEVDDAEPARCQEKLSQCEHFLANHGYSTELLPDGYPGIAWCVKHIVARPT
jgi:FkbM family methyltransferase